MGAPARCSRPRRPSTLRCVPALVTVWVEHLWVLTVRVLTRPPFTTSCVPLVWPARTGGGPTGNHK